MPIQQSIKLNPEDIALIKELSPMRKFDLTSPLFYEGQVPIVAYLLVDGSIVLFKKKKIKNILKAGSLVGLNELLSNSPSKLSAQVSADSILCFLDKSTMLEYPELVSKLKGLGK